MAEDELLRWHDGYTPKKRPSVRRAWKARAITVLVPPREAPRPRVLRAVLPTSWVEPTVRDNE